jgi:hypothetical protein
MEIERGKENAARTAENLSRTVRHQAAELRYPPFSALCLVCLMKCLLLGRSAPALLLVQKVSYGLSDLSSKGTCHGVMPGSTHQLVAHTHIQQDSANRY